MTIERFRKMDSYSAYYSKNWGASLLVHVTRRPGTYGHQFAAAIVKDGQFVAVGSLTGGCGFDKEAHAAGQALRLAGFDYNTEVYRKAASGAIRDALALAYGESFESVTL